MLLGGLQLDCHGNNDKLINNNVIMEAIQIVDHVPSHWVCPVEYELYPWQLTYMYIVVVILNNYSSTGAYRAVATLLQAMDNQV